MTDTTAEISINDKDVREELSGTVSGASAASITKNQTMPSVDAWLKEAKNDENAGRIGMYLTHNGVVRSTAKAAARMGEKDTKPVVGLYFAYDSEKVSQAIEKTREMEGIHYVRVWLNEGQLSVGDDIMLVLIGGDIRPRVIDALQALVSEIKTECVVETEIYE